MKIIVVTMLLFLTGCRYETEFGKCVGADESRQPDLVYRLSLYNVAVGILTMEFIAPPLLVLRDVLYCPTGRKQDEKTP